MNITIRAMAVDDYPAVAELWRRTEGIGLNESDTKDAVALYLHRNPGMSAVGQSERGSIILEPQRLVVSVGSVGISEGDVSKEVAAVNIEMGPTLLTVCAHLLQRSHRQFPRREAPATMLNIA